MKSSEGSFYIFNAGCIRRAMDVIHIQKYLEENNWRVSRNLRKADLIIIATCGVVRLNEVTSLRAIYTAERMRKRDAKVVITGCLPKINPDEIRKIGDFTFIPTGCLEMFDSLISASKPFSTVESPDSIVANKDITNYMIARSFCRKSPLYKALFYRFGMSGRFLSASVSINSAFHRIKGALKGVPYKKIVPYFNIRISDGCLSNCSFCATKFATGRLRSRPPGDIVDEFKKGLMKGYTIFQLIAEDTGCYGMDIGLNLTRLLEKIFSIQGDYQLVIIDCNPQWLVRQKEEILPLLIDNQERVKELFVPVQSGSDRVLERMGREYTSSEVRHILEELNRHAPLIGIRTGFMVGFPGESDEDFARTKEFISGLKLSEATVNRYEDRPGTPASRMPDKLPEEVIEHRALILSEEFGCHILS